MPINSRLLTKVCLLLISVVLAACSTTPAPKTKADPSKYKILHNLVGYEPAARKDVFLVTWGHQFDANWSVTNRDKQQVLKGNLKNPVRDPHTYHWVYTIDLSTIEQPGVYTLLLNDIEQTQINVEEDVFHPSLIALLRSYYLQRCGHAVHDSLTGMHREMCHIEDGVVAHDDLVNKQGTLLSAAGGWHDAGDYGKYVSTTAVVLLELLTQYERHTEVLSDIDLEIPESDNGLPDFLDEMKVGLDWMLTSQRTDGAVYRKLSGNKWPSIIPPEQDKQTRYLYGVFTADTAKAVAAWALAARVFQPHDPQTAQQYLAAAEQGWQYLETQEHQHLDFHEDDDGGSGPYIANDIDKESSLFHDKDDRTAAAIELWLTTGVSKYSAYYGRHLPTLPFNLFEWKDPALHSVMSLLWHPAAQISDVQRDLIKRKLLARANAALRRTQHSGYRLANHRFVWGSNKMAAEEALVLSYAYRITGNTDYLKPMQDQLDYLYGRNIFSHTFVTGVGVRSVENVSHILVRATGQDIPGLFVGGPNSSAQANIAPKDKGPMSYKDHAESYATNEYAIDYNSALIALLIDLDQTKSEFYQGTTNEQTARSEVP